METTRVGGKCGSACHERHGRLDVRRRGRLRKRNIIACCIIALYRGVSLLEDGAPTCALCSLRSVVGLGVMLGVVLGTVGCLSRGGDQGASCKLHAHFRRILFHER